MYQAIIDTETPALGSKTTDSSYPFVSVIIPVFNDEERLRLCLQALQHQTYPYDRYEVIPIDNGSTRDIAHMAREFPDVIFLREDRPGSYTARNRGLAVAKGSIIALTDADCIPEQNWIEAGVSRLLGSPNCGLVAGNIKLFFSDPHKPTSAELYESVTSFHQKKYVEKYHFGATANVFTYRSVFDKVGLFNEQLRSSGDREWGERVHASGYAQVYADEVVINHPARRTFTEVSHRNVRLIAGTEHTRSMRAYPLSKLAKAVIKDLVPYKRIYLVWTSNRIRGVSQRLRVSAVMAWLQAEAAITRLRVRFGKMEIR